MNWERVTREHPCGICGKPDWCCKGQRGWNCMRVESTIDVGNGGWFHPFDAKERGQLRRVIRCPVADQVNAPDFAQMLSDWRTSTNGHIGHLAFDLGVSEASLKALGTVYVDRSRAFAFPMVDDAGVITGIRLRGEDGSKWAVKGSHHGLFMPLPEIGTMPTGTVMICEGPSDTAAALTLGIFAIGRPACLGCEQMVAKTLEALGCHDAILCVDNDGPGVRGAEKLADALRCRTTRFVPPAKDLRQFLRCGGTLQLIQSLTGSAIRSSLGFLRSRSRCASISLSTLDPVMCRYSLFDTACMIPPTAALIIVPTICSVCVPSPSTCHRVVACPLISSTLMVISIISVSSAACARRRVPSLSSAARLPACFAERERRAFRRQ